MLANGQSSYVVGTFVRVRLSVPPRGDLGGCREVAVALAVVCRGIAIDWVTVGLGPSGCWGAFGSSWEMHPDRLGLMYSQATASAVREA